MTKPSSKTINASKYLFVPFVSEATAANPTFVPFALRPFASPVSEANEGDEGLWNKYAMQTFVIAEVMVGRAV